MRKIINIIGITLTAMVIFTGCEEYATKVDIPKVEKKIVVHSFISPGEDTIAVMLTWSKPIIGTANMTALEIIPTARVEISDGKNSVILPWNGSDELYELNSSQFSIVSGQKYYLTVSTPDGKRVKATCVVPFTKNTTLVLNRIDSNYIEESVTLSFSYKDSEPFTDNYYRLYGQSEIEYPDFYALGNQYIADTEMSDNNLFKFTFNYGFYHPKKARCILLNCDYNYFQYHKSLLASENNQGIFTEPSLIFSNIEGGLGCFGAYDAYELEVDL